jgi:ADP-ribosylglycohydrolase
MASTASSTMRISLRLLHQKTAVQRHCGLSILCRFDHSSPSRVAAALAAAAITPSLFDMATTTSNRNRNRNRHSNNSFQQQQRRNFSGFSFAGPRELQDVLKTELLDEKKGTEIADLWFTYHETKVRVCVFFF